MGALDHNCCIAPFFGLRVAMFNKGRTLMKTAAEDRIRAIAHELWLKEGQPEGRAEAHWQKASELADAGPKLVEQKPVVAQKKTATRKR